MCNRLVFLLLLVASTGAAEAQYSTPTPMPNGSKQNPQNSATRGCPWLTEGTAATALGGDVTVTVNKADTDEGSCKFSREPDFLDIQVSKAALTACPGGSMELKGIGNEATRCNSPGSHGHSSEMVSSRVRDLYFTVTLARRQKSGTKPADPQNDALEQVAEEVAGSLY